MTIVVNDNDLTCHQGHYLGLTTHCDTLVKSNGEYSIDAYEI